MYEAIFRCLYCSVSLIVVTISITSHFFILSLSAKRNIFLLGNLPWVEEKYVLSCDSKFSISLKKKVEKIGLGSLNSFSFLSFLEEC